MFPLNVQNDKMYAEHNRTENHAILPNNFEAMYDGAFFSHTILHVSPTSAYDILNISMWSNLHLQEM